jgi:hypothetical protein
MWHALISRSLPTLPSGRVSWQNALVDEAVGGVDDPTARWSPLTSTAFFEKKAAQKNFSFRVRSNGRYLEMDFRIPKQNFLDFAILLCYNDKAYSRKKMW